MADWIYSKERIDEFQIISDEQFKKAQKIKESRINTNKKNEEINKEYYKYQTKGDLLFTGYIFCGGCGGRLTTRANKKQIKNEDGTIGYQKYRYYACMNKINGRDCSCKQRSFKGNVVEEPVIKEIYNFFDLLEKKDLTSYVKKIQKEKSNNEEKQLKEVNNKLKEYQNKNELLKEEIMKAIMGTSAFSKELIAGMIEENNIKIEECTKNKISLEKIVQEKNLEFDDLVKVKKLIPNWKEVFEQATIEQKKMLLTSIIKEVIVYDDKIDVKLKISFDDFFNAIKKSGKENSIFFENLTSRGTFKHNTNMGTF